MEATILKWHKKEGDHVELDETILDIATDKVDTEIPSPVSGTVSQILFQEDSVVEVGKVIAIISTEGEEAAGETQATCGRGISPVDAEANRDLTPERSRKAPLPRTIGFRLFVAWKLGQSV